MVPLALALVVAFATAGCSGCSRGGTVDGAPTASADPAGKELVPGTVVAAVEKGGGIRLYKVVEVNWFPDPMGEELVLIAYEEKADTFEHARVLWTGRDLTVVLPTVRVARHMFVRRDHRVIGTEPVSEQDKKAKAGDVHRRSGG